MPKVFRISDATEALNRSIVTGGEWEWSGTDKRPGAACTNRLRTLISAYAGCNLPALAPNGGFGPAASGPPNVGASGLLLRAATVTAGAQPTAWGRFSVPIGSRR